MTAESDASSDELTCRLLHDDIRPTDHNEIIAHGTCQRGIGICGIGRSSYSRLSGIDPKIRRCRRGAGGGHESLLATSIVRCTGTVDRGHTPSAMFKGI